MMMGRVDNVDGHFVATEFLAFAIPLRCMYIAREDPRTTQPGFDGGIRLRTDPRSIAIAYGRTWSPVFAVAIPGIYALSGGGFSLLLWMASAILVGLSVFAYRAGSLPETEKKRLRVLGTVTGLRIDPSRLHTNMRDAKRDSLGVLMEKGGIPLTPDGIISVIDDIPVPALPLVYGYCCYAGDTPEWVECATQIYQRHEQAEF